MRYPLTYKKIISFAAVVYVFMFLFVPFPASSASAAQKISLSGENLVDQVNKERTDRRLNALTINDQLNRAAQAKADDMARGSYFSHMSPDGKSPWFWFYQSGYAPEKAGENLAVVPIGERGVVQAWMNSAGHRENILRAEFEDIGMAAARGIYKGREVWFVVQEFGRRL